MSESEDQQGKASKNVVIHVTEPPPARLEHPCLQGHHRWAWLVDGGQECYRCGKRRR